MARNDNKKIRELPFLAMYSLESRTNRSCIELFRRDCISIKQITQHKKLFTFSDVGHVCYCTVGHSLWFESILIWLERIYTLYTQMLGGSIEWVK
jgi:hypothetical protein